jgi:hypothetical protein
MKLFTKALQKQIPPIDTNANTSMHDLVFYARLFTPWSNWTWYIAEANFETGEAFGLCCGFEKELGYVDLNELAELRGIGGLKVERDLYFTPCKYAEAMQKG